MTRVYERLQDEPQIRIDPSALNYEERIELRQISVSRARGSKRPNTTGQYDTVYYLEGDERAAAEVFVDENREALEGVDFGGNNAILSSVDREIYDWILHFLGERTIRKYSSVVLEERRDGTQWLVERDRFEQFPNRRYAQNERGSVRIAGTSVDDLYDEFGTVIDERVLEAHDAVDGDTRYILEYYRVSSAFDCDPEGAEGALAIRKR